MRRTNDQILSEIRQSSKSEQRLTLTVIELIKEVELRKIHLELGFGSLFEFVTKDLGYEPASAMRRIQAARLIKELPEMKQKIEDGRLSLTVVSQVQSFFKKESTTTGKRVSLARKKEVLSLMENKSSREAEKELVKLAPETIKKTESVRELTETLTEMKLVVDAQLKRDLDELKLLLSHQNPQLSYVELIRILARRMKSAMKARTRQTPAPEFKREGDSSSAADYSSAAACGSAPESKLTSESKTNRRGQRSRHIPASARRLVWQRDQGCCQYVDPRSGRKCSSRYQLQIDHIHRFREGGRHETENLRLYCAAHNRLRA